MTVDYVFIYFLRISFYKISMNVILLILAIAAARFVIIHQEVISVRVKMDLNWTKTVMDVKVFNKPFLNT